MQCKEQAKAKQKNKKQNTMKNRKIEKTQVNKAKKPPRFYIPLLLWSPLVELPPLNPKTYNPKPNSNLLISLPNPKKWIRVFMWKPIQFSLFFFKNPILVLLGGSHMAENLKTGFQPGFHPKWELTVLNVRIELRTGLRTESSSENRPTLVLTSPNKPIEFLFCKWMAVIHLRAEDNPYGAIYYSWATVSLRLRHPPHTLENFWISISTHSLRVKEKTLSLSSLGVK